MPAGRCQAAEERASELSGGYYIMVDIAVPAAPSVPAVPAVPAVPPAASRVGPQAVCPPPPPLIALSRCQSRADKLY